MNVAVIGSVSSSAYALRALIKSGVEITGVLGVDESRADSISDYQSLRTLAQSVGLPYCPFIKVSEPQVEQFLREHTPDLLWVIGLSQLVPNNLVNLAHHGGVGFHPTMLPRGRGRAPVAWTILLNQPAAANLFFLSDEPDAGDIIIQKPVAVLPDDYAEDLIKRTNEVLHDAIIELAPQIKAGRLPRTAQDHSQATYYPRRTPEDGRIDWKQSTEQIYRLIRAAGRPYPGAFTFHQRKKLIIWRARPVHNDPSGVIAGNSPPGRIAINASGEHGVATGDGYILPTEMEVDGVSVAAASWLKVGQQCTTA